MKVLFQFISNPEQNFNYSGEGIYYLQRVVEHITNEPLESFAKRTLFDKLGLESTSFVWTEKYESANCNRTQR